MLTGQRMGGKATTATARKLLVSLLHNRQMCRSTEFNK